MPGDQAHPQPRVQVKKAHELVTTGSPNIPAFPARWFYGFLRALSGDRAFLSPSPVQCVSIVTELIPASRHQDHTTSPSAPAPLVRRHQRVHRILRPTFVTIGQTPLWRARDGAGF